MKCGLGSTEEIAACLFAAKEILGYAQMVWGIVSATLVFALLKMFDRWTKDALRLEGERDAEKAKVKELQSVLADYDVRDFIVQVIDAIGTTVANWHHAGVAKTPHIPKDKDTLARRQAPIPGEEEIVALFDFTGSRVRSMSSFLVVTYDKLYWTGGNALDWQSFVDADINVSAKEVLIDKYQPIVPGGGFRAEQVADMLVGLHKALTPYFENNSEAENAEVPPASKSQTAA